MKTKFLQISLGLSAMMLSAAFLIQSISPTQAAPSPKNFLTEGTNKIGKYMMQMYTNGADPTRRYGIVWDTETGKSIGYFAQGSDWVSQKMFPENPLEN